MLAQLKRDQLVNGIQRVISGLPQKATLPILSYVRMVFRTQHLLLEATDLDVFMRWDVPCESMEGELDLCIPVKKLYGMLRDLTVKDVVLEGIESKGLRVVAGNGDFKFYGLEAHEFPSFPSFEEEGSVKLPCGALKQVLDRNLYCVGTTETREVLNGLLIMVEDGMLRSVATDGRRLATDAVQGEFLGEHKMIMPRKAMTALRSCLDSCESDDEPVEVLFGANHGSIRMTNGTVFARLLDGDFPDYRDVIPSNPSMELKVNREALLSATRRVGLFSVAEATMIKVRVVEDRLILSASSTDIGEASEVVEIRDGKGQELELGINHRYVGDALSCIKEEEIYLDLVGSRRPVCVRGSDSYRAVVMPMRLEGVS